MATVLVIGSHGRVGQRIVKKLANAGQDVVAGFRSPDQFETVAGLANVTPAVFDLAANELTMVDFLNQQKIDQVVFSAGAGGKGGAERTVDIDLDGAVKTMDAAKKAEIQHYVMVSAAGADDRTRWEKSGIYTYFVLKHYADRILRQTGLPATIVRPTSLTDDAGTGRVSLNVDFDQGPLSIARDDVADFVVAVLAHDNTINKTYDLTAGDQAIQDLF
ncbi:SDR family oxidoreductase [Fructobacillus ficulneus]|uniref:NAD(P)-binding domain-containing protein n=1 Tax=Fructobacillus ficulneus TaxID=157463 RepID=A0A0K8MKH1_9LACO|nr:SDR family oxidoreductase [Fructobacillus ficulneus]GAP00390.1 hypothetical protein FFIC_284070 [Fructobacillus ficulneus]